MDLIYIIIIIVLAYLLYKCKKKNGEDLVNTANKYGEALKNAATTFKESVKKKDSTDKSENDNSTIQEPVKEKNSIDTSEKNISVATGSGTDALHMAYILAGLKRGDEVITTVFTCTATNIPLLYMGIKFNMTQLPLLFETLWKFKNLFLFLWYYNRTTEYIRD